VCSGWGTLVRRLLALVPLSPLVAGSCLSWEGFCEVIVAAVVDECSSERVTLPKSPATVSLSLCLVPLSLGFVPNRPPLLERLGCRDEVFGLKLKRFGFVDVLSVDMVLVSGDPSRALAFGLKMAPNGPGFDPPENTGPAESGAEDVGVKSEI
jgi:hypothetical protein